MSKMAGKHVQKNSGAERKASARSNTGSRSASAVKERRSTRPVRYEDIYDYDDGRSKASGGSWLRWAIPVLAVLLIVVGYLAVTMASAQKVAKLGTIYPNITVAGVDLGGMTVDEAVSALEASDAAANTAASVTLHLPFDRTVVITAAELGVTADARAAAEEAYAYGRGGSLMQNLRAYRACKKQAVEIPWNVSAEIDAEKLRGIVEAAIAETNAALLGSDAEISEEGVTVVKGMSAESIDAQEVYEQVLNSFQTGNYEDITVEFQSIDGAAAQDQYAVLEAVYQAIFVEPKNAEYDKTTGGVTESVRGVSFDMEAAKRLWDAAQFGEKVFIPFVFTEPEITSDKLQNGLFADLLAEKSTSLSGSSSNRINNVTLSAEAVNGTILEPGDTFDYNKIVGQRTTARGYKEAGAYSGGKHVNGVGGGICQTSSTVYYCAMYANLNITTRSCHYFAVSYLPRGFDATVSWGGPDFRFTNSRDYPVKIKAWVSNGQLTVQIWGTNTDGSYVKMTSDTWEDSTHYYAQTYRELYAADGTLISRNKEAYSSYSKYEESGETPQPETDPTPTPSPTPDVTPTPAPTPIPETAAPTAAPTAIPTAAPTEPPSEPDPTTAPEPVDPEPPVSDPEPESGEDSE